MSVVTLAATARRVTAVSGNVEQRELRRSIGLAASNWHNARSTDAKVTLRNCATFWAIVRARDALRSFLREAFADH